MGNTLDNTYKIKDEDYKKSLLSLVYIESVHAASFELIMDFVQAFTLEELERFAIEDADLEVRMVDKDGNDLLTSEGREAHKKKEEGNK